MRGSVNISYSWAGSRPHAFLVKVHFQVASATCGPPRKSSFPSSIFTLCIMSHGPHTKGKCSQCHGRILRRAKGLTNSRHSLGWTSPTLWMSLPALLKMGHKAKMLWLLVRNLRVLSVLYWPLVVLQESPASWSTKALSQCKYPSPFPLDSNPTATRCPLS